VTTFDAGSGAPQLRYVVRLAVRPDLLGSEAPSSADERAVLQGVLEDFPQSLGQIRVSVSIHAHSHVVVARGDRDLHVDAAGIPWSPLRNFP
jgi:hypothetical protein